MTNDRTTGEAHPEAGFSRVPFHKWADSRSSPGEDSVVIEEPLEYHCRGEPIATVMRTPGHDGDLAVGFLYGEGWITGERDIGTLCLSTRTRTAGSGAPPVEVGVVDLTPSEGTTLTFPGNPRYGPMVSSCGICGKKTVEEIFAVLQRESLVADHVPTGITLDPAVLVDLPQRLRRHQPLFDRTGALHAAGIFDLAGASLVVREDVGRHNAVDKAIGRMVRRGAVPLNEHVLVVSGRASFEIIQKALRAGLPLVVTVSGVTLLAVELADRGGITLCGFTRGRSFSVYSHSHRVRT